MSETQQDKPVYLRKPNRNDYINGFFFAVVLTAIPFFIVGFADVGKQAAMIVIAVLAAVQMVVHIRYFLHYSTKRVAMEATVALGLAVFMGTMIILGCLWVMFDLHGRMLP